MNIVVLLYAYNGGPVHACVGQKIKIMSRNLREHELILESVGVFSSVRRR